MKQQTCRREREGQGKGKLQGCAGSEEAKRFDDRDQGGARTGKDQSRGSSIASLLGRCRGIVRAREGVD